MRILLLAANALLLVTTYTYGQSPSRLSQGMGMKLNEDGSHYIKITFLNQVWLRYNASNPGTLVNGEETSHTFDIGLRRTRFQFYGQLNDHLFFYTQFGQNNFNYLSQNSGNRKLQAFFHDALAEYKVWKSNDKLKLGGGLTIANGLSRFSQPSIGSILTTDVPVFAQATVDQTDEFSRKLSVYARGQVGKLDYRVVLSDPFPITTNGQTPADPGEYATFSRVGHQQQVQGFFIYNILNREPHTTPYMTGTYLGKRKVLNIEGGFISQPRATWAKESEASDTTFYDLNLWSAALYYDAPLDTSKGTALSAYAGYFHLDYGAGYLRYNGIMNPANGVHGDYPAASAGNAFPMFGTGNVIYGQLGYLFPRDFLGEGFGTLLPYVSLMSADYDRLPSRMNVFNAGMNWLMEGHSGKLSLDYQNRPVYSLQEQAFVKAGTKGQITLQYQIYF